MKKAKTRHFHPVQFVIMFCMIAAAFLFVTAAIIYKNAQSFAQTYATHALGHQVTIGRLQIHFYPFSLTMDDVSVANAPWAAKKYMMTVGHMNAAPDMLAFLTGRPAFYSVTIEDAKATLERNDAGIGNWKKNEEPSTESPDEAIRKRRHLPVVLDLTLRNSSLVFYTVSDAQLTADIKQLHLITASRNDPVTIEAEGAYNDIPVHVEADTGSFANLHDASKTFPVEVKAQGATADITTKLEMMDPLNFDQFVGTISGKVGNIGKASALLRNGFEWEKSLNLESKFLRQGDRWALEDAEGNLQENVFKASTVTFLEGKGKEPDTVKTELAFAKIDIAGLMPEEKPADNTLRSMTLKANEQAKTLIDASVTSDAVTYKKFHGTAMKLHANVADGLKEIDTLTLTMLGSKIHAMLRVKAQDDANQTSVKAELPKADIEALLHALGIAGSPLTGKADINLLANATGTTAAEWQRSLQGHIHIAADGTVSRRLIQLASIDISALFGQDQPIAMPCMVGELSFSEGTGILAPFQIVTAEGTLYGTGIVDMPQKKLDLAFRSDSKTTSGLALDAPIHLSGSFDAPSLTPFKATDAKLDFSHSLGCNH